MPRRRRPRAEAAGACGRPGRSRRRRAGARGRLARGEVHARGRAQLAGARVQARQQRLRGARHAARVLDDAAVDLVELERARHRLGGALEAQLLARAARLRLEQLGALERQRGEVGQHLTVRRSRRGERVAAGSSEATMSTPSARPVSARTGHAITEAPPVGPPDRARRAPARAPRRRRRAGRARPPRRRRAEAAAAGRVRAPPRPDRAGGGRAAGGGSAERVAQASGRRTSRPALDRSARLVDASGT